MSVTCHSALGAGMLMFVHLMDRHKQVFLAEILWSEN